MKYYVVGFFIDPTEQQIVLIRKNRPKWQAGLLNGVGGKLETLETPLEAMRREFYEETGVIVHDWQPTVILHGNDPEPFQVNCFIASGDISQCESTTDEQIEIHDIDNIANVNIVPNLRWLIPLSMTKNVVFPLTIEDCVDPTTKTRM